MLFGVLKCGQHIEFVDQVLGSAQNEAHWVRQTFICPNYLKLGIYS
jgi:hypothetical protein